MLRFFLVLAILFSLSVAAFGQCAPRIDCPYDIGIAVFKNKTRWVWRKGKDGVMHRVIQGQYYHRHTQAKDAPEYFG